MKEKVPWWRRALDFALDGIRTGFGLFRRGTQLEPAFAVTADLQVAVVIEPLVAFEEPHVTAYSDLAPVVLEPMVAAVEEPLIDIEAPQVATELEPAVAVERFEVVEEETVTESSPNPEDVKAEALQLEAEPAVQPEALKQPEPQVDLEPAAMPAPVAEAADPAGETAPVPAAELSAPEQAVPEPEAIVESPAESAPEPTPVTRSEPVQQMLPLPELTREQKTAEKVAAAMKARGDDGEQSPFSVIVSKVYDGPLDLLLDLIRKQDIDIYDIPIAKITAQFLAYVDRLKASDVDVAGDFIYTAALLIHIKSKMLLPRAPAGPEDQADDPRRELVERLLEHERFKNAAQMLHEKQMLEAATWTNPGVREFKEDEGAEPEMAADTTDLVRIFRDILDRARSRPVFNVEEDAVTVGQMMQFLARRLTMEDKPVALRRLLSHTKSERALIAMFLALLEMVRLQAILLRQDKQFSEIFIKKHTGFEAAMDQGLANAQDDWR